MRKLRSYRRDVLLPCALILWALIFSSCSIWNHIPTVSDEQIESVVREEAARLVAVTEDKENFSRYQIFLADFPRKDILGLSVGRRRIYISYRLGQLALKTTGHRWFLRQTLAHEIAHELADHANQSGGTSFNRPALGRSVTGADLGLPGHIQFRSYSAEKELEADLNGMEYWSKLHWDCRIWVRILEGFREQNYSGDVFHPTDERLQQALQVCLPKSDRERVAVGGKLEQAPGSRLSH